MKTNFKKTDSDYVQYYDSELKNQELKFLDINSFVIRENNESWRKNFAYIPQNIFLLDDTIKNNIVFGKDNVDLIKLKKRYKHNKFRNISKKSDITEKI